MPKNNDFWDNLAQMYHGIQNPAAQPMQPQVGAPQQLAYGGYVEPQELAEGGYVEPYESNYPAGNNQSTSNASDSSPWYMDALKGFAGSLIPAAGQAATGMLIDRMFPGSKPRLLDTRQPEQQQAGAMGLSTLSNLQKNPNSFGLPGDPNDVNTPAGKRLYEIKKGVRDADAARGSLNTGGSAQRETDAVNKAIGDSYQAAQNSAFSNLNASSPALHVQSRFDNQGTENPWSKILTNALAPGVGAGLKGATDTAMKKWFI